MITPVADLLGRALRAAGLEAADQLWRVHQVWPTALGGQLHSRAVPLRLTRGELVVAVPDAVWRQELSLLAPRIVARLNEQLGAAVVERLKLVGAVQAPPPPPVPRRRRLRAEPGAAPEPAADLPSEIGAALRSLRGSRARRLARDRDPHRQEKG